MIVGMYSGGASSFMACLRVKPDVLLFADTGEEHPSLYESLEKGAEVIGSPLVRVGVIGGMTEVIATNRAIPSSRLPFCSYDLKVKPCNDWLEANAKGAQVVIGYIWEEQERIKRTREQYAKRGHEALFPLVDEKPWLSQQDCINEHKRLVGVQSLYEMGFPHNNCGGACVKAGISQWKRLLEVDPERFALWEQREAQISELHSKTCTVLKRSGRPYPLHKLKSDVLANVPLPMNEYGGCGCFSDQTPEGMKQVWPEVESE